MIIKIERHRSCFTQIANATLEDSALSFKAKGILAYLLSKNREWVVSARDLANHSTDKIYAVKSALRELKDAGYARMQIVRGNRGRIVGRHWIIYETKEPRLADEHRRT